MMFRLILAFLIVAGAPLMASLESVKRVHAHLAIGDTNEATVEANRALYQDPHSQELWETTIEALSKNGEEIAMMRAWEAYLGRFPDQKQNRNVLEEMAWGVIEKGCASPSPIIRVMALLGAYHGQDARGVALLEEHLQDKNVWVRGVDVQLAMTMRDDVLRDAMARLFLEESSLEVRLDVIRALGAMQIEEASPTLVALLTDKKSTAEEKAAAIQGLVNLAETAQEEEIALLAKSDRAGLRLLACRIVEHFRQEERVGQIIPLLTDHNPEVRRSALEVLTVVRGDHIDGKKHAEGLLDDTDPYVAILAARVLTLYDAEQGQKAFRQWLQHDEQPIRLFAAASFAATGNHAFPFIVEAFTETDDPYVAMNLAFGMIRQRNHSVEGVDWLYQGVLHDKGRWMSQEEGGVEILMPSDLRHQTLIPNYPQVVDQLTRLEILNVLAVMEHPQAQEAIKQFLSERAWGVSGLASTLLLSECDETTVELVKGLLDDPNEKVRVQAALILAMWARDEAALTLLEEAYDGGNRELKERILESLGQIGATRSIPFLVEKLKEPYQSLRLIAAASLLQCLYR